MKNKKIIFLFLLVFVFVKPAETNITEYIKYTLVFKEIDSKKNKTNEQILRTLSNKIHEHYEKLFRQKLFNGCILVAMGNQIVYQNAFGYNDIRQKSCLNLNDVFQLASVSKIFTATAILKLYEKNLLNIYDYVKKYIPDFPYPDITVKQLLQHTSGLPNYLHLMPDISRQDTVLSHQSVLQFLIQKKHRPEFKAGRRYKYCNTNYVMLACLIEKVSGMTYSDFLKKEIFIPANMQHTNTIYYIDIFSENTVSSYEYKSRVVPFYAGDFILGDKSIYSDIHDLFNFSQHFLNGKILNDTTISVMTKGIKTDKSNILYGCGIRIRDYQDSIKTIWFHNGWWHGYRTSFQVRVKDKVTVIVLSNDPHKTAYYTHPVFQIIDEILYDEKNVSENVTIQSKLPAVLDEE